MKTLEQLNKELKALGLNYTEAEILIFIEKAKSAVEASDNIVEIVPMICKDKKASCNGIDNCLYWIDKNLEIITEKSHNCIPLNNDEILEFPQGTYSWDYEKKVWFII